MVVTGIMVIITSVVLVSNGRFGGVVQLENLAYDVALSIRQAQVYGIAVRRFGASTFNVGYGMHFDTSNPTTYVLFADTYPPEPGQNGLYDAAQGELVQTTDIANGYRIANLCAPAGAVAAGCTTVSSIDMLFKRPDPDAFIRANSLPALVDSARVILVSPRGNTMSVVVEASGQISVRRSTQ